MNAEDLLAEIEALGATVIRDGDSLTIRPGSAVPQDLLERLRAHKPEVLELVGLRCWPEASRECLREFRVPEARLYPFLGLSVATTQGPGRLVEVLPGRAGVRLDSGPERVVYVLPSEVWPPDLTTNPDQPFEAVH